MLRAFLFSVLIGAGGGPVDQREWVGVGVGGVDRRVETKICSTETGPKLKNYVHDG